jgi:peroxiredoxin
MRRWSANTWVVVILFTLIGLIAIDVGRQMLQANTEQQQQARQRRDMKPEFNVGDKAPDFSLPNHKAQMVTFSEIVKGDTLLWFTCGCNNCLEMQEYMGQLSKILGKKAPRIVNVSTMPPEREEAWLRDTKLKQTILYEANSQGPVGMQYKGHPCPRFYQPTWRRYSASRRPTPREAGASRSHRNRSSGIALRIRKASNQATVPTTGTDTERCAPSRI